MATTSPLSRRTVLAGAAVVGAVGVLGVPRPAGAAPAAPGFRIDGLARVNGLFGSSSALYATGVRDDDDPVLLSRAADGSWQPVPVAAGDVADLADGAVLPDGSLLLVGAASYSRVVDLSSADVSADGAADATGTTDVSDSSDTSGTTGTTDAESYVFAVSSMRPAVWRVDPSGEVWRRLPLGLPSTPGRLTGVAVSDAGVLVVGHWLPEDSETPEESFSLLSADGWRAWQLATLPTGPLAEGAVVDVDHVDGRWLAVGFDLHGSTTLASEDGLVWVPEDVPTEDPEAQVQEVSSGEDGSSVVLTAPADDVSDGASTVVDETGSATGAAPGGPVFSVQVLDGSAAVVASASGDSVVIEEVGLVGH